MHEQTTYDLKLINGKLVIDLKSEVEFDLNGMTVRGYDGLPSKYDPHDMAHAPLIAQVTLSGDCLARIKAEYKNGGICGWCDEVAPKLRPPHMFDRSSEGSGMCQSCWEHDREMYKGSYGEDIGPFEADAEEREETTV